MGHYWLGLATIPLVIGVGALLYSAVRAIDWCLSRLFNRIKPGNAYHRAQVAAVTGSARRVLWLRIPGDVAICLLAGHDWAQVEQVRDAVLNVLDPRQHVGLKVHREEADRG